MLPCVLARARDLYTYSSVNYTGKQSLQLASVNTHLFHELVLGPFGLEEQLYALHRCQRKTRTVVQHPDEELDAPDIVFRLPQRKFAEPRTGWRVGSTPALRLTIGAWGQRGVLQRVEERAEGVGANDLECS